MYPILLDLWCKNCRNFDTSDHLIIERYSWVQMAKLTWWHTRQATRGTCRHRLWRQAPAAIGKGGTLGWWAAVRRFVSWWALPLLPMVARRHGMVPPLAEGHSYDFNALGFIHLVLFFAISTSVYRKLIAWFSDMKQVRRWYRNVTIESVYLCMLWKEQLLSA
jgi:hypothetical protein